VLANDAMNSRHPDSGAFKIPQRYEGAEMLRKTIQYTSATGDGVRRLWQGQ
jgi:hypothetical protein